MSATRYRVLSAVIAASLVAFWLHLSIRQSADSNGNQTARPDLVIKQPFWQVFDENGAVRHTGRAARLEQWPGESQARLLEPRLTLRDGQLQHWQASARRGRVSTDRQQIVLERQARLQRRDEPGAPGPVLSSEQLRITQPGNVVETDQAVVLVSGNWQFNANGLRAELGRHQMQLLGNVRGRHD